MYKCLLIFTSNDESEKIKSIEYPIQDEKQQTITPASDDGKNKVALDYQFEKGKDYDDFKVTTTKNNTFELTPFYKIKINIGNETVREIKWVKGGNYPLNQIPQKENHTFYGWEEREDAYIAKYTHEDKYYYKENDTEVIIYAIMRPNVELASNSLIKAVEENNQTSQANITINNETYTSDFMVYNEDLVLDGTTDINGAILKNNIYEFGNEYTDVAKDGLNEDGTSKIEYAQNMVILKVNGNLTVNSNVTLTACKSTKGYGGPKGLLIYCTGTIYNGGIIDMTARGARAEGQDVYLWQNTNGNYEYVPAVGGIGGEAVYRSSNGTTNGNPGENGQNRATGGGGSGASRHFKNTSGWSGAGSKGTSYSGGTGGGGSDVRDKYWNSGPGEENGGTGGYAYSNHSSGHGTTAGAGNPGGVAYLYSRSIRWSRNKWNRWFVNNL